MQFKCTYYQYRKLTVWHTVSVSQRPLTRAASTRASAAATKSRALPAQGSMRFSPRVPLLQLPPPPREPPRLPPSRRKEYGFSIGRGRPRSPTIEPDYDEDDEWWKNIVEEKGICSYCPCDDIQRDHPEGSAVGRSIGLECWHRRRAPRRHQHP